jgi:RNA polymerase sigma factor (sigma-70 family)
MTHETVVKEFGGLAVTFATEHFTAYPTTLDREDLTQIALLTLMEAASDFDGDPIEEDRKHFKNYLRLRVREATLQAVAKVGFPVSGDKGGRTAEEAWQTSVPFQAEFMQAATPPSELGDEDRLSLEAIYDSLDILTDRQREIIGLYYLDGLLSDTLVAERLGIHKANAMRARERAEKVLREALK